MAELQPRFSYCFSSIQGLLKWLQMIFSSVILGLLLWETVVRTEHSYYIYRYLYEGEQYTVFVAAFALCVIALFLMVFFCNCHQGPLAGCRCFNLAQFVYFLLLLMWIAAAGVEVWVTTLFKWRFGEQSDLYGRRAAAAALCFANMLVNAFSIYLLREYGP